MRFAAALSTAFILAAFSLNAIAGSSCQNLDFIAIEPQGPGSPVTCSPELNRTACAEAQGFSKFASRQTALGKPAHAIKRADPTVLEYANYLEPLRRSPITQEMNGLRILAREITRETNRTQKNVRDEPIDVCEPNYVYVGSRTLFGVGPALLSSERFQFDDTGKVTTNFITMDDAALPYHIPVKMASKDALIRGSYYEMAIAHEMAHALMQDIYGVDVFRELEASVVSRDGHMSSIVTDPTLAWVEGFAEGFEAYLGEKHLTLEQQQTPHLDQFVQKLNNRMDMFMRFGWRRYAFTIPSSIFDAFSQIVNVADLVTDFLKAERQAPARENLYILRGNFVNLAKKYDLAINVATAADIEDSAGWTPERDETVFSKEGITAHLVYKILNAGLFPQMVAVMAEHKPGDLSSFAQAFREQLTPEQWSSLEPTYKSIFTTPGREVTAARLAHAAARTAWTKDYEERLNTKAAKAAVPDRLPKPKDLWIEFWNMSLLTQKLQGGLDRINLATAVPGRIAAFLDSMRGGIHLTEKQRDAILASVLAYRNEHPEYDSIEEFADGWANKVAATTVKVMHEPPSSNSAKVGPDLIRQVANKLFVARFCFEHRCLSQRAVK